MKVTEDEISAILRLKSSEREFYKLKAQRIELPENTNHWLNFNQKYFNSVLKGLKPKMNEINDHQLDDFLQLNMTFERAKHAYYSNDICELKFYVSEIRENLLNLKHDISVFNEDYGRKVKKTRWYVDAFVAVSADIHKYTKSLEDAWNSMPNSDCPEKVDDDQLDREYEYYIDINNKLIVCSEGRSQAITFKRFKEKYFIKR